MIQPNHHRRTHRQIVTASVSLLVLGLAACGSDSKASTTTAAAAAVTTPAPAVTSAAAVTTAAAITTAAPATSGASATTAASTAGASGTAVDVKESEFKIDLPQTTFTAGTYTFNITNAGNFKHNLIIEGNGNKVQSDTLNGGATGTLSVPLTAGTYEVYCGVPTHKGKGMDLTITVT
ncbi:MAG TPA: plastocyanin/azurin family copper-binding protein [Ilumatobacteraceae bacterium]